MKKQNIGALSLLILAFIGFPATAMAQTGEAYGSKIAKTAEAMAGADIQYDPAYVGLSYPFGDVAQNRGVCADVVIRAFRAVDIDFQKRVHEDMKANFSQYPTRWGLSRPDKNIDHRRVLNLEVYLRRAGAEISGGRNLAAYQPGDIVGWTLPGGLPHMGIVSTKKASDGEPLMVHHIGGRPRLDKVLFEWEMTGHYRYFVPERARDR
jgi:uncharacterized protein